ncbi:rRNA (cytosine-C(5))-methyltransferase NOP2C-like isoform X3 [Nymphaea colorata]|uniref:rRNA (cytosine-C(5))-methyltransferase NOP2C-like isoform X3 n=1 Tax=Nymphaea colorata TaxID=210225 RepID=UPI00129D7E10|nr:rRNA (cytosine-C(5))-methyltransferase NOP2C-like isoform X3 [Nymphaea colorata]
MENQGRSERSNAHLQKEPSPKVPLPKSFLDFLALNGLSPSVYDEIDNLPRYIRLKPGSETLLADVEAELGCKLENVNWLPGFFAIASQIQIARSKVYCEGKIYGIDAASGAAVTTLNVLPGDHILDLCAAPGAKLCMLAELLGSSGSLTGVDIAKSRLAACRTMLQKYALGGRCRLFVADGTTFSLLPLGTCTENQPVMESENGDCRGKKDVYQEWSSRVPWSERRKSKDTNRIQLNVTSKANTCELIFYGKHSGVIGLRKEQLFQTGKEEANDGGYDKVLVDAECTHDGSVKHILKFEDWGWDTLQRRLLNSERIGSVTQLQLQLLTNGFRLLKVGGSLVYSTCSCRLLPLNSLTVAQNEDVVEQFLSNNHSAEGWPCRSGRIPRTIRFDTCTSRTSGLFIAKIVKLF